MGKQFDRLETEQLKNYYLRNFEEFSKTDVIAVNLVNKKAKFVIGLHEKLKDALERLPKEGGLNQERAFEKELYRVFDERNTLREEVAKITTKLYPPPKGGEGRQIDEYRLQVLEEKLNLIEEELKVRGIKVKIDNGKVIFKEISQESA